MNDNPKSENSNPKSDDSTWGEHLADRSSSDFESSDENFRINVRNSSIINGGAALAILGLLGKLATSLDQKVLGDLSNVISVLASSIGILCIGLLTPGIALLFRARAKSYWGSHNLRLSRVYLDGKAKDTKKLDELALKAKTCSRNAIIFLIISYTCFALGIANVLITFFIG